MAAHDVLTLDEAKAALSLNLSGTKHDAELPGFITSASVRLDRLIGPVVQRVVTSELHDGGREHVFLRFFPVFSVQTVTEYEKNETAGTVISAETNASRPDEAYLTEAYVTGGGLLSGKLTRRSSGGAAMSRRARWAKGERNVAVSYTAGRFADTASIDPLYKQGAGLILANMWRSQQDSTGQTGEFDVPQSSFPRFAVPRAVLQLFEDEIQQPRRLVA